MLIMNPDVSFQPAQTESNRLSYLIATFYRFVALADAEPFRKHLLKRGNELGLCGTILVAEEGINATIAGHEQPLRIFLDELQADPRLSDLTIKYSHSERKPFERYKVRLKSEIVTLKQGDVNPNQQVGTYVKPQDWNALISDPEVILIDTRNDYETAIGMFKGAIDPQTQSFRELPDYVHQHLDPEKHTKVAMYCTGGIRCEKSTSWMLSQGFKEVYHLEGGILNYLAQIPAEESLWQGECFVFDERVAVGHGLEIGQYSNCMGCGRPVAPEDLKGESSGYEPGVSCPKCINERTEEQRERSRQIWKQRQIQTREAQLKSGQKSSL